MGRGNDVQNNDMPATEQVRGKLMTSSTIGTVWLRVADLQPMIQFYEDIIGLRVQDIIDDTVFLGVAGSAPLLALIHKPDGRHYRGTTGLYHFAILLPSRLDLAIAFRHLLQNRVQLQGASDHIVSEAVYLADPEGNGIEIYRDRPREEWYRNGQMQLDTLPMDAEGVLGELKDSFGRWNGLPDGTIMGHIHLHVANVPQAAAFYQQALGMDLMFDLGSAAFLSYHGYHHHVGANIWNVRGLAPEDALGLERYEVFVTPEQYEKIAASPQVQEGYGGLLASDPSQNTVVVLKMDED